MGAATYSGPGSPTKGWSWKTSPHEFAPPCMGTPDLALVATQRWARLFSTAVTRPQSSTRLSPCRLMRIARTPPGPPTPTQSPNQGLSPLCPPSPKAQGGNRGHSHKTMLPSRPHPDLPLLQCPVCGACSIHPAGGRPGGLLFFATKKKKKKRELVGGSAAAGAPTPPVLHPHCIPRPSPRPACSGDSVWSARPWSNSLPRTRPGWLWGLVSWARGPRGGGAEPSRRRPAGAGWVHVVYSRCGQPPRLRSGVAATCSRRSGARGSAPSLPSQPRAPGPRGPADSRLGSGSSA